MEGSWGVAEVLWVSPPCPGAGRAQGSACPCNSVYRQLLHWKALGKREGWAWEFAERLPQDQDLLLPRADLPWKEAGSGCSMAQPQGLLHSAGPTQHSATLLLLERGLCSGLRGAVGSRMDLSHLEDGGVALQVRSGRTGGRSPDSHTPSLQGAPPALRAATWWPEASMAGRLTP